MHCLTRAPLVLLALFLLLSQFPYPVVSSALPNALPARHLPPVDAPGPAAAGATKGTTETSSLALLRAGPAPVAKSAEVGNAQPAGSVGPAAVGPNPAAPNVAAVASVSGDVASATTLGADACAAGGECARLGEAVVSAVEGSDCRALHVTGKCPAKCLSALNAALGHKMWDACHARCETDVVAGAAQRWLKLCEARQVSLIDQGKEAVKSLVVSGPGVGRMLQAIVIVGILVGAVMIGYRRGLLQGHALRLQKRMKKRGSDRSFV